MKFKAQENPEPELNLVSLIDVLLMTLIFLVVTTSFSKEAQLRIKLPEAAAEEKVVQATLQVTVDARGQYFINDKQLLKATPDALRNAMFQAAGKGKKPSVVIYADGKSPHQSVIRVMDAARRLGYINLTFATRQPSKNSGKP
ncbi:MAG: biopolymer transporter ExbD [Gammaproteobacteria bacterium]|nr:MAG: biopolymer transporter ExbD [Gammaproteobacteria bacterium]